MHGKNGKILWIKSFSYKEETEFFTDCLLLCKIIIISNSPIIIINLGTIPYIFCLSLFGLFIELLSILYCLTIVNVSYKFNIT